jgi:hypothetical protein
LPYPGNRIGGELLAQARHFGLGARNLLVDHLHRVVDLADL